MMSRPPNEARVASTSFCGKSGALSDGARAGYQHGFFRDDEWVVVGSLVDCAAHQVVDRRGTIEDGSRAQDGAFLDYRAFVHAAVAAHQYIVFNDYRQRAYGLQHATDLRGGRD